MIIFLYGEDSFRSNEKLKEIKEKFRGSANGAGLSFFDFSEKSDQDVISSFGSQGLFSSKRLVVVKNLIISGAKEIQDAIQEHLKKNPGIFSDSDLEVVFFETKMPAKNKPLFKFLEKNEKVRKEIFEKLLPAQLSQWIRKKIDEINPGQKISAGALSQLILLSGENMWMLENEIEKLSSLAFGREICEEDVEKLTASNVAGNIFSTVDAIGANDKKRALALMLEHFSRGDDPFYILSMLVYQFRNLLLVADFYRRGMKNELEISQVARMHPFVVRKSLNQVRKFEFFQLKDIYGRLQNIDQSAKTGKVDIKLALSKFVVEI
ncbi:MAG: DNA polymerase III subunit delta [Patescibacteria group bacterium]